MGKIFHSLIVLTLASCATVKKESYEVRDLSEEKFLYEDVHRYVSEVKDLKELNLEKSMALYTKSSLYNVTREASTFTRIDLKRSYILDVGLFIKDPGGRIAPERTKIRPAGKYLIVTYKVPRDHHGKLFEDFPSTIKEAKVTPQDLIVYMFRSMTERKEIFRLFLRVK